VIDQDGGHTRRFALSLTGAGTRNDGNFGRYDGRILHKISIRVARQGIEAEQMDTEALQLAAIKVVLTLEFPELEGRAGLGCQAIGRIGSGFAHEGMVKHGASLTG
jgi:hypothetical protein